MGTNVWSTKTPHARGPAHLAMIRPNDALSISFDGTTMKVIPWIVLSLFATGCLSLNSQPLCSDPMVDQSNCAGPATDRSDGSLSPDRPAAATPPEGSGTDASGAGGSTA